MLFSIYRIEDKLLVACGGGDKKFGVKNKINMYQIESGYISKNLVEENLDQIPEFIEGIPSKKIFGTCCKNKIIFYSISPDNNSFKNIYTLNINQEDISLDCFKINEDILATGDDNGSLRLFKINFSENKINSIDEICRNDNAHSRGINKIIFFTRNKSKFLLTASQDGTCKIFDINNLSIKMISFFSFRQFQSEFSNYFMRDLILINQSNLVYTLQSMAKGKSFLTKWDISNINFVKPIETIKISDIPCFSFDITENNNYLGTADSQGNIYFVDTKNMIITGWRKLNDEDMVKNCRFYDNYLITGSIGNIVCMNKIITGFTSKLIKFAFDIIFILAICYYSYLKKNNLIDD